MPLVEREDFAHVVTFGEHHNRSVREADAEVRVTIDDLARLPQIRPGHGCQCLAALLVFLVIGALGACDAGFGSGRPN